MTSDFLEEAKRRAQDGALATFAGGYRKELFSHAIGKLEAKVYHVLGRWERLVVYDMASNVIAAILEANLKVCEHCINATKWKGLESHPAAVITGEGRHEPRRCEPRPEPQHEPQAGAPV